MISITQSEVDGWVLPDQSLVEVLESGLQDIQLEIVADRGEDLFRRLFANMRPDKRQDVYEWFARTTFAVVLNYPRVDQEFPCYVVSLEGETEEQYVGSSAGRAVIDGSVRGTITADRWTTFLNVIAYAEHPEMVVWMHHLAKWIITNARCALTSVYHHAVGMSGRDFEPVHVGGETGRLVFRRGLQVRLEYDQFDTHRDFATPEEAAEICETDTTSDIDPRDDIAPCCPPDEIPCDSTIRYANVGGSP